MANETTQKVRLVKCPKCRKLLPEPAGVPLYSCGGCGSILRAKLDANVVRKKNAQNYASPNSKASQGDEDRDVSGSVQTVSIESDRIFSSAELSSPFPEPNLDSMVNTEESSKVRSSTDGYGKSSEKGDPSMPMNGDSTMNTVSKAIKSASAEYIGSIFITNKITEEVSDDEIEDRSLKTRVNASERISDEATTSVSRKSKERFIQQRPSIDPFPKYMTESSKSNLSSSSYTERFTSEGLTIARGGYLARSRARSDSEGFSNRMVSDSHYGSTSYSRDRSNDFLHRDKEELMRMVVELENQLKSMSNVEEENSIDSSFNRHKQQFNYRFDPSYSHDRYGTTSTYSMSPQARVYSNLLWDSETNKSDDQMVGFLGLKNPREKTYLPKRHFRPLAGASPFLTCYRCFEVLHVPEDFLVSGRKRCHWLKCGACSMVLRFSLQDGTHIAPFPPELENHENSIHGKKLEDLHNSLDHGVSAFQVKEDDDRRVSYGSSESFKPGIKEAPGTTGSSALHQLMGYSSVSQLLS